MAKICSREAKIPQSVIEAVNRNALAIKRLMNLKMDLVVIQTVVNGEARAVASDTEVALKVALRELLSSHNAMVDYIDLNKS